MLLWLFVSLLAGSILCTFEFMYIILTCGPFWMGPEIFLKTWVIYSAVVAVGLLFLNLLIAFIPPLNKRYQNPVKRFHFQFSLSLLFSGAALIALIMKVREVGIGNDFQHYLYALFFWIAGIVIISFTRKLIKDPSKIAIRSVSLSLFFVLLAHCIYFITDWSYASEVKDRSTAFRGNVPHVALIVLDTTRGDHLSCYGYQFLTSPNLDEIAGEGLLCTNAYSTSNWTPPGHISIFTGKYPSQHGNNGQPYMPEDLVSLTEILVQQGYYCIAMTNNRFSGKQINLTQGFDDENWVWLDKWVYPSWMLLWNKVIHHDRGSKVTFPMAAETFKWVQRKGGHLFLYVNVMEPHLEYDIHQPYFDEFTSSLRVEDIPNLDEVLSYCNTRGVVTYDSSYFVNYNEASFRYLRAAYDSEVAYMDYHFGIFSDEMRKADLLDQTLLVITSDHGEFLGEHFTKDHPPMMYNPAVKVPLILRYPALITPTVLDDLVSTIDIFPTALDLLGCSEQIPDGVEGINFLKNQGRSDRWILCENNNCLHQDENSQVGSYSLFDGTYKLMLNNDPAFLERFPFDTLLLNIKVDPDELMDVRFIKREKCDSMAVFLNEWLERITVFPVVQPDMNEDVVASLKALGYVQ